LRQSRSNEEVADAPTDVLPQLVDKVSPEGRLPGQADLEDVFGRIAGAAA
jgi:uncharacterized protein YidB (DUF937 family)